MADLLRMDISWKGQYFFWDRTITGTPSAVGNIFLKVIFFEYIHVAQAVIEDIFNHRVLCIGFLFILSYVSNTSLLSFLPLMTYATGNRSYRSMMTLRYSFLPVSGTLNAVISVARFSLVLHVQKFHIWRINR